MTLVDAAASSRKVVLDEIFAGYSRDRLKALCRALGLDRPRADADHPKLGHDRLRQHGYPPDKSEKAVEIVLKQAELLAASWAA